MELLGAPTKSSARTARTIAADAKACALSKALEGGDDQGSNEQWVVADAAAVPAHTGRYSHRSPGRTNAMWEWPSARRKSSRQPPVPLCTRVSAPCTHMLADTNAHRHTRKAMHQYSCAGSCAFASLDSICHTDCGHVAEFLQWCVRPYTA